MLSAAASCSLHYSVDTPCTVTRSVWVHVCVCGPVPCVRRHFTSMMISPRPSSKHSVPSVVCVCLKSVYKNACACAALNEQFVSETVGVAAADAQGVTLCSVFQLLWSPTQLHCQLWSSRLQRGLLMSGLVNKTQHVKEAELWLLEGKYFPVV